MYGKADGLDAQAALARTCRMSQGQMDDQYHYSNNSSGAPHAAAGTQEAQVDV
jgi:hypothetical protein